MVIGLRLLYLNLKQPPPSIKTEVSTISQDRILILAPHPDDEVLGCGGIVQEARKHNIPLKIVFLTYGDNNEWSFLVYRKHPVVMPKAVRSMGLVRHNEALEAAKILGVPLEDLIFLGYPDFRTLDIWYSHWGDRPAAESMLTHVRAVPYDNAFRPGAPYKADEILSDLKTIIREFKPTKIFVSHPADHNPDHKALYLFTRVALWELRTEANAIIYPYLVHFKHWPRPTGYHPEMQLTPPAFFARKISWKMLPLSPDAIKVKHKAIQMHRSQFKSAAKYLLSFIRSNELFGDFSIIKLRRNESPAMLTAGREIYLKEMPEQLLDEERATFVGIQEEYVSLEEDSLVYSLKLSRPLGKAVGISLFVFGYRDDVAFPKMPKIHIRFGAIEHKVFDQNRKMPSDTIKIHRKAKEITMRIPLKLLGEPQRILTSARSYTLAVPLDWVSWRVLEIETDAVHN